MCLLDYKVNFILYLSVLSSIVGNRTLTGIVHLYILDSSCKEFTCRNCSRVSLGGGLSVHQDLYVPLVVQIIRKCFCKNLSVQVIKKSQFALKRKKSKAELDFGDLVCPLDPNKSGETQPTGDGVSPTNLTNICTALLMIRIKQSSEALVS